MGRFLGSLFIAVAIVCLMFFISLEPEDSEDHQNGHADLSARDNQGSIHDHDFSTEQESEIRFTYNSARPIRVILKNRITGDETMIEAESTSTDYQHYFDEDGNYAIRLENQQDQGTQVDYTLTTITKDDEGPRPFCGVFTIIFLILGIIFLAWKKQKKGPSIIHARQMLYPTPPPSPGQGPHPPAPGHMDDLTPRSPFAPPPQDSPTAKIEDGSYLPGSTGDERTTETAPDAASPPSSPAGDQSHSLGYHDSRKPTQAFPMPKDTQVHGSHFRCPDCGTVIFINQKIKKVKCPKCSHTFRVEKQ